MGRRRFSVADHLGVEELAARYRAARDPVERGRWRMIRLLVAGQSLAEVVKVTGYSTRWVREVMRRYNETGPEGLAEGQHANPGATPLLDADGRQALEVALEQAPAEGRRWGPAPRWRHGSPGAPGTACRCRARACRGSGSGGTSCLSKRLGEAVAEERARHLQAAVEVWAFDEHRAGLEPVVRRVWAKRGRRPVATVGPRYAWLYLYGFVRPTTDALVWFPCNTVNTALFSAVLARFAAEVGAGPDKRVIPVLDGAGWHATGRLTIPAGLRLQFLPPYPPELQPAEHLWPLTDESIANRHFASLAELDRALAERCLGLCDRPETIKAHTRFYWWPEAA